MTVPDVVLKNTQSWWLAQLKLSFDDTWTRKWHLSLRVPIFCPTLCAREDRTFGWCWNGTQAFLHHKWLLYPLHHDSTVIVWWHIVAIRFNHMQTHCYMAILIPLRKKTLFWVTENALGQHPGLCHHLELMEPSYTSYLFKLYTLTIIHT